MAGNNSELKGPDFEKGVSMTALPDGGMIQGHAFGEQGLNGLKNILGASVMVFGKAVILALWRFQLFLYFC